MKAIKIDVETCEVYYIDLDYKDYRSIYPAIGNGCNLFSIPVSYENGDGLYVDDEGLMHPEIVGYFTMKGWEYPIAGNAIILGSDEEGESKDCKTDIEDIRKQVIFIKRNHDKTIEIVMFAPQSSRIAHIAGMADPSAN